MLHERISTLEMDWAKMIKNVQNGVKEAGKAAASAVVAGAGKVTKSTREYFNKNNNTREHPPSQEVTPFKDLKQKVESILSKYNYSEIIEKETEILYIIKVNPQTGQSGSTLDVRTELQHNFPKLKFQVSIDNKGELVVTVSKLQPDMQSNADIAVYSMAVLRQMKL